MNSSVNWLQLTNNSGNQIENLVQLFNASSKSYYEKEDITNNLEYVSLDILLFSNKS